MRARCATCSKYYIISIYSENIGKKGYECFVCAAKRKAQERSGKLQGQNKKLQVHYNKLGGC